jgi:hypothetical protein
MFEPDNPFIRTDDASRRRYLERAMLAADDVSIRIRQSFVRIKESKALLARVDSPPSRIRSA